MSGSTKIEWCEKSWNPITGCGPDFQCWGRCYARRMAHRLANNPGVKHRERYEDFRPTFWPERLEEPMGWKKPSRIFVSSMGDLFHRDAPFEWVDQVFAAMALCPQHIFMVLTKRPERMAEYINDDPIRCSHLIIKATDKLGGLPVSDGYFGPTSEMSSPLLNVQLGVTCENQEAADERIPLLLKCPAAVRYLSLEPLLGPIDLRFIQSMVIDKREPHLGGPGYGRGGKRPNNIHGVIVGGETGPGARPMHPDWIRSIRDQCTAAGVPFFFKSWGEWLPQSEEDWQDKHVFDFPDGVRMFRHGYLLRKYNPEKLRLLDGVEHNDPPEAA